ncbi:GntR family transcriptional regulator [Leucobacter sp. wl10]|uniref:GntR family transcriptional regulator n=1 Tax=Leucobacter sp. wl10 TaxID=2304677 RepID=UPI0013C2C1D4|nr:GntR family transcriptional regulator [Leucobacter sp. wl10]
MVRAIETNIRRGELRNGQQLDGEVALAEQFSVSRGTIRQALDELKQRNLVTTVGGVGSFVTFDGVALQQSLGWARALRQAGGKVATRVIGIDIVDWAQAPEVDAADAVRSSAHAVRIRRVREMASGEPVSYEVSFVPATGVLRELPATGLVDGSIWASLSRAGLRAMTGTQDVRLARLDETEAALLEQDAGAVFLRTDRWSYGADGRLVEFVTARLDPDHFRLTVMFGDPA